jgi:hypothetical protein
MLPSAEAETETPAPQAAPAGPNPAGSYAVVGEDLSEHSNYDGTVQVTRTGGTFKVRWKLDTDVYNGVGVVIGGAFVVASLNGDGAADIMIATPAAGGWAARWTSTKDTVVSTETWTARR